MYQHFLDLLAYLRSLLWRKELELCLVGLQNAGKTTLVNALAMGTFDEDMIPTVGFNMRKVRKGGVSMKLWDLGGQPRFRGMWERYCRGVNAIVFVVDAADSACTKDAKEELQKLLSKPSLAGIPLLVLGNKNDLPFAANEKATIEDMALNTIKDREVSCFSISAKNQVNLDTVTRLEGGRAREQTDDSGLACPVSLEVNVTGFPAANHPQQKVKQRIDTAPPPHTTPTKLERKNKRKTGGHVGRTHLCLEQNLGRASKVSPNRAILPHSGDASQRGTTTLMSVGRRCFAPARHPKFNPCGLTPAKTAHRLRLTGFRPGVKPCSDRSQTIANIEKC
eukprot:2968535-Rhodomonas_salina.5